MNNLLSFKSNDIDRDEEGYNMESSKRIEWIDFAKGIAILMVLLGHAIRDDMRTSSAVYDLIYRIVYIFHMPFFFWISGYTSHRYRNKKNLNLPKSIRKKLKKQILPWIAYTIFIFAVFSVAMMIGPIKGILFGAGYTQITFVDYILSSLQANNPWAYHLWFIYVFFIVQVIVDTTEYCVSKCKCNQNKFIVATVLITISFAGLFVLNTRSIGDWHRLTNYVCCYVPFYVIGGMMSNMDFTKINPVMSICGLGYIIIRALFFSGSSGNSISTDSVVLTLCIRYASYIFIPAAITLMCYISRVVVEQGEQTSKVVCSLGKNSFMIYLWHQPFCCAFLGMVLYSKIHLPAIISIAVSIISSILVAYTLSYLWKILRQYIKF